VGHTDTIIKPTTQELADLQRGGGASKMAHIMRMQNERHSLLEQEEMQWRQRATKKNGSSIETKILNISMPVPIK
jgi:hypothetical protein